MTKFYVGFSKTGSLFQSNFSNAGRQANVYVNERVTEKAEISTALQFSKKKQLKKLHLTNDEVRLKHGRIFSMDERYMMTFTLINGSIDKFDNLRQEYELSKKIKLNAPQSMIGMPTLFGGTNVKARNAQISFLEKFKIILQPNLIKDEDIKTQQQWETRLTASRVFIAANLFVLHQIGNSNSKLRKIIHEFLGISANNRLEQADKEICFYATSRSINSTTRVLDEANASLKAAGKKPISEKEWKEFTQFINTNAEKAESHNPYLEYPITSITQPLFGALFSYTGASIGYLGGDFISNSVNVVSYQYKLTALIGGVLLMGPVGPAGVALFAPLIAGKLINTFCSISMAHIMAVAMGMVGQGVGMSVGMPLDIALKLMWKTCSLISDYHGKGEKSLNCSGFRLVDGALVQNGIVIELADEASIPEGYVQHMVTIEQGEMFLDGTPIKAVEQDYQLRNKLINELKDKLSNNTEQNQEEDYSIEVIEEYEEVEEEITCTH